MTTTPFSYPVAKHLYRHGPSGYVDYESYRPWLRDEFDYRCVYCLFRERWIPVPGFHIDHLVARVMDISKLAEYRNLLYACPTCNSRKSSHPLPSPIEVFTADSVTVNEDGTIEATTDDARRLIYVLGLNSAEYNEWRRLMIDNIAYAALLKGKRGRFEKLYQEWMSYPENLPNLGQLKPPHNSLPMGIAESAFERRLAGELPDEY